MTGWPGVVLWTLAASALQLRDRRRLVRAAQARHEVRGPLAAARLALDGLERSARVQAVELELRRAALALDDLAGFDRARDRLELVDVGRALREASGAWDALAAAAGTTLAVESPAAPAHVRADPLRLVQACANLVANAVEHGAGPVTVRTRAVAGRVHITVSDSGPGLPDPLPSLVAAARGRRSARGHGLAIAAGIAERHGGRLHAGPGPGAHLTLDLPQAPTTREPRPRPALRRSVAAVLPRRLGPFLRHPVAAVLPRRLGPFLRRSLTAVLPRAS